MKFLDEFARFKALSRALFKFATADSSSMPRPMQQRAMEHMQPLNNYGILGRLPMLPFALSVSRDVAWTIHTALCSLSGLFKNKRPPLRLAVQQFKPPKFVPSVSLVGVDSPLQQHARRHFQAGPDSYVVRGFAGDTMRVKPRTFALACPNC